MSLLRDCTPGKFQTFTSEWFHQAQSELGIGRCEASFGNPARSLFHRESGSGRGNISPTPNKKQDLGIETPRAWLVDHTGSRKPSATDHNGCAQLEIHVCEGWQGNAFCLDSVIATATFSAEASALSRRSDYAYGPLWKHEVESICR